MVKPNTVKPKGEKSEEHISLEAQVQGHDGQLGSLIGDAELATARMDVTARSLNEKQMHNSARLDAVEDRCDENAALCELQAAKIEAVHDTTCERIITASADRDALRGELEAALARIAVLEAMLTQKVSLTAVATADAGATYTATEQALLNELKAILNQS